MTARYPPGGSEPDPIAVPTAWEWLVQAGDFFTHRVQHPDDYDPTDEELMRFIRAIQANAIDAAAQCAEAYAMTGVPVAEAIRALLKDEGWP